MRRPLLVVLFLAVLLLAAAWVDDADCYWCTPTYCAFDQDCPDPNCSCCIDAGEITGECC